MMKERPIIFNAEMVRAILDGRKTQTRRVIKTDHERGMVNPVVRGRNGEVSSVSCRLAPMLCPHGQPGDRLWVRESFQGPLVSEELFEEYRAYPEKFETPEYCEYAADGGARPEYYDLDDNVHYGWRPSIHMPRWASRITLEITDVRVERLNDISDSDALAEGVSTAQMHSGESISDVFGRLWKSIYGSENWDANPWVWVIEFRRMEAE
ncbi:morphogenetic protein [Brenneria populi subsp. brevivirga]|nr:morphogenetic protein [Brenneria populi subsp. brevivirga]